MASQAYFLGVDVGTQSVRAALVSAEGKIEKVCVQDSETFNPQPDFYIQSSDSVWSSCVYCIKDVLSGIPKEKVKGLGFDATCSLVVLDKDGKPLTVCPATGDNNRNIILWLDHRAIEQAAKINSLKNSVLKYVGGTISPEMETPKLLWLKTYMREQCWNKAGYFFDLPDFLTWKATKHDSRSLCSVVCKWTYEVAEDGVKGWSQSYFTEIGLEDLVADGFKKIGTEVFEPGHPVGNGLDPDVAAELGLLPGTPVGASIIDAHAGGLGLFGCQAEGISSDFDSRFGLICGTSTCHMAVAHKPVFTPGVWGPYKSAMVPEMWLAEGGQSTTGKVIDHVIDTHPATKTVLEQIGDVHIQEHLSQFLVQKAQEKGLSAVDFLTKEFHIWPDFHGNRSPLANPELTGMICGLTLAADEENLAIMYLATLQALGYGTKHILEALLKAGFPQIKTILICGGLAKNPLFIQAHADIMNLPVLIPEERESMLLGTAILGASAAGYFKDVNAAIMSMGGKGKVIYPNKDILDYHRRKYAVFLYMVENQMKYKDIMGGQRCTCK